jgi:hypothetical protein
MSHNQDMDNQRYLNIELYCIAFVLGFYCVAVVLWFLISLAMLFWVIW